MAASIFSTWQPATYIASPTTKYNANIIIITSNTETRTNTDTHTQAKQTKAKKRRKKQNGFDFLHLVLQFYLPCRTQSHFPKYIFAKFDFKICRNVNETRTVSIPSGIDLIIIRTRTQFFANVCTTYHVNRYHSLVNKRGSTDWMEWMRMGKRRERERDRSMKACFYERKYVYNSICTTH